MASNGDTSPTTGEAYYSGSWEDIKNIVRVLNIGSGKLAVVTQELVNKYMEMVDRDIDSQIGEVVHTPLICYNKVMPDGKTKQKFPGSVVRMARYWTAGLLLANEFQSLDTNASASAEKYIQDAKEELFRISRFNHRLEGQEYKSNISRTMPPGLQPPDLPTKDGY